MKKNCKHLFIKFANSFTIVCARCHKEKNALRMIAKEPHPTPIDIVLKN